MSIKKIRSIRVLSVLLLIVLCTMLTGCPPYMPKKAELVSGDFFREQIIGYFEAYSVHFSDMDTPNVTLGYINNDQSENRISFLLDGYDPVKKFGFKFISLEDMKAWENDENAPKPVDAPAIRDAALEYEFPIMFIWIPEGLGEEDYDSNRFYDEINDILKTQTMRIHLKTWLYDGKEYKKDFENHCTQYYGISFLHDYLPTVDITYYENKKAVFQLDGYDPVKQIGYKFVTAKEEQDWNERRKNGDEEVPDLADSEQIAQSALYYDFPVLFNYSPAYWTDKIGVVFSPSFSALEMDEHIEKWLKEH